MKRLQGRFYPAILCALLLAGRAGPLRAEEPQPLNGLHLSDVQAYDSGTSIPEPAAKAVVLPPVPLDRRGHIESVELDARGKPRPVSNPDRPFSDSRLSPVYQSWMSFFENGATTPSDLGDEWTLVGAVSFEWAGNECRGFFKKRCKVYRKSTININPEGLRVCMIEGAGAPDYPGGQKFTLNFTPQTVTVTDLLRCNGGGAHPSSAYPYSKSADSVHFMDSQEGLYTRCRIFKNDPSKMICEAHSGDGDYFERHTFFTIYSRDDGKDLLEPMDAILKPFAAPIVTLKKSHPKN